MGRCEAEGERLLFFIFCFHLWDEAPRGGLRQEISADHESYTTLVVAKERKEEDGE